MLLTTSYRILPLFTASYRILPHSTETYRMLPILGSFAVAWTANDRITNGKRTDKGIGFLSFCFPEIRSKTEGENGAEGGREGCIVVVVSGEDDF